MKNNSPWIHQLHTDRPIKRLERDIESDVVIVGGGIAGISTAFFVLRNTDKKIVLLEGNRLGHGATGHNAGQITSTPEKMFSELVEEFGLEMATEGQRSINSAWELMDEMYTEAGLDIPFSRFTGFAGFSTIDQITAVLNNNVLKKQGGLDVKPLLIAQDIIAEDSIPEKFVGFYNLVPQSEILEKLETRNKEFIGLSETQKGVINSALFTEEVALYLLKTYPERFQIFENTLVPKVVLKDGFALLDAEKAEVRTERVVLCTNGFEKIKIFEASGLEIDTRFHHLVDGVVARMSGFVEDPGKPPVAISYYIIPEESLEEERDKFPYFYLTRRAFEKDSNQHNLICLGGPQEAIPDTSDYSGFDYPEDIEEKTDAFLHKLYDIEPSNKVDYAFTWHGLMGYTTNGVRLVGEEPKNSALLYNLGCNGVGILPSIFGGSRIAKIINREDLKPSIFDPRSN